MGAVVCIFVIIGYLYYLTRPTITQNTLIDECGPIGGTISHSIDDDDSCSNMCRAYCKSTQKEFHDTDFTLKGVGCNDCECYCKE